MLRRSLTALTVVALACGGSDGADSPATPPPAEDTAGGSDVPVTTTPPTAKITAPADGTVFNLGQLISLQGKVTGDRPLRFLWESDGPHSEGEAPANGTLVMDIVDWAGKHVVTLTATDPSGRKATDTITITVNEPPVGSTVVIIEPAAPVTADKLVAKVTNPASDPDGAVTYTFTWFVDGEPAGVSGAVVAATLTQRGQVWKVVATPSDGHAYGKPGEASVTILNTAPFISKAVLFPSAAGTLATLTCTAEGWTDPDGDAEAVDVAWEVNGKPVAGDGATLSGDHFEKGDIVACFLTPTDGTDSGIAVKSEPVPIVDTPASVEQVQIDPLAGDKSTTFTCTAIGVTDPDAGDNAKFNTVWVVNGAELPGTTSQSFSAAGLLKGDAVRCKVVPYSGDVEGSGVLSPVVVLADSAPTVGSVILKPVPATEATPLTCIPAQPFDLDGDNVAFSYHWYVNDTEVPGVTGDSLDGASYDKGDVVWCEAVPFDGELTGEATASKFKVTIVNAPPSIAAVEITPGEGSKQTTFTCTALGWSDPDPEDAPGYLYTWKINGVVVAGGLFQTLVPKGLPPGDLTCVVTPNDGTDSGAPVESPKAKLVNHAPAIGGVTLGPSPAFETTVLTCAAQGWSDEDGDPESYLYTWAVNGVAVEGAAATLDGASFDKGQVVVCTATPFDGSEVGPTKASSPVQIANSPPALASATLTPPVGGKKTEFQCAPAGFADADDGDPELYAYSWKVDGMPVAGALGKTFAPGATATDGDEVSCAAQPFDGTDYGAAVESGTAVIANVPPEIGGVAITPAEPGTAVDLTCSATGVADPDGDTVSLMYAWFVNDSPLPAQTKATLAASVTKRGDKVVCQATPSDGSASGVPKTSLPVAIVNSPPSGLVVAIQPAAPTSDKGFQCVVTKAATDPDGDVVTVSYAWEADDAATAIATATVAAGTAKTCETWTCLATPSDGTTPGATATAQAVVDEGSGITLDGTGKVEVASSATNNLGGGKMSVEAWVNISAKQDAVIVSKRSTGPALADRGFMLTLRADGKASLLVDIDTSAPKGAVSAGQVPLLQWVHVAGSYDGATARVFIGGKLEGTFAIAGPIDTTAPLRIGQNGPGGDPPYGFVGGIDEVRLANDVYFELDFPPSTNPPSVSGTVGLYHFTEGAGMAAADASGKANGGTLSGGAAFGPGLCSLKTNSPPGPPAVTVTPESPAVGVKLTCAAVSVDPDGDLLTYNYTWLKDDVPDASYKTSTLPAGVTGACQAWTCRVAAYDGKSYGATGEDTVAIGASGGITWYKHHSYDPTANPPTGTKKVSQFFASEEAATRFSLPAGAFPLKITHLRVLTVPGKFYNAHIYTDAGEPGLELASAAFLADGTYQTIKLAVPTTFSAAATFWVSIHGSADYWTVYGDANGESPANSNMYYACESLFGDCASSSFWKTQTEMAGLFGGSAFAIGDFIIDVGTDSGGTGSCP